MVSATRASSNAWTLSALSLSMLLSSLGTSIANVALPTLAHDLDATFQAVQWVVVAYLLANTVSIVGAGRLGDRAGRRRLLLAGLAIFALASLACASAPTLAWLVAARAVQGVGAAVLMASSLALVSDVVPKAQTGRAMGLLATMASTGTALGPSIGGVLIGAFGWSAVFVATAPLCGIAFLLASRHLPADARRPATRTAADSLGSALLAAARDPTLRAGLATSTLIAAVMMATLVVGPFYLSRGLGLDAAFAGIAMSVGPLVSALTSAPLGRAVDRLGAHGVSTLGLTGIATGTALLSAIPPSWGVAGYLAAIVIVTSGYAAIQVANNTIVMGAVPPDRRGLTSGLLNLSRNVGLLAGVGAMGAIFAAASGSSDPAAASSTAVAAGMHVTFAAASGLAVIALLVRPTDAKVGRAASPVASTAAPPAPR